MAEEEKQEEVKKKKSPLLLFIIIGILLVGGSVGGTLFIVAGSTDDPEDEVAEEEVRPEALYFALVPAFQTNYEVRGRQRLFQVAISLQTRLPEITSELALHSPSIRSKLVILLSGQSFDTLQTLEGRNALKEQVKVAVNGIMSTEAEVEEAIEKVLFTEYVTQ